MKSIVIYYSHSGNTKKIAQGIQKGITQRTGQCDLARLKEIKPEEWINYDLIGIGSPVWGSKPAPMLADYVNCLPPTVKGKHAFFYCTHGTFPGRSIIRGVQPLQEQGLTVIGWKDWYCGCIPLPGHAKPWFTDGHPDAIDIAEAESFGTAMAEHSRKISKGATDIIPALPSPEASDEFYGVDHPAIATEMKAEKQPGKTPRPPSKTVRRVNPGKCTGCGLCAEACYYNNIDTSVSPPVFGTKCCECSFCEMICPTGAVEVVMPHIAPLNNNSELFRVIMPRILEIAEAKGRFRRLVREEDMNWNVDWEKEMRPPRLKEIP
jgi:formate hydrogenlyase subunit 6/NADH:ubiquinone oxidoreductase subunit I